jgi:hypothetical protein
MPEHAEKFNAFECPILIKQEVEEKEDPVGTGTDYEHHKVKD